MIVAALGRNQLDSRRAASMLYGLQVATAVTQPDVPENDLYFMETEAVPTPEGGDLAVDETTPAQAGAD